jgi:DNA polymerase-3 subunit alpha
MFVHLHTHTQYSILDGASSIGGLVARAKALGMPALAITDHGNMFGAKEFHEAAAKAGVKPIIGCEVYVVRNRREKDKDEKAGDHLILLAKNLEGYHNLTKIVSYSYIEGFYYKPRIDKALLREHSAGLICCSACLGGEVPQAIMHGNAGDADRVVAEFKEIFGEDYYLEMQLHRSGDARRDNDVYANQLKVNAEIVELARRHGVKYICSNDVHFVMAEDAEAHDRLICLNTGKDLDDPARMRYTFQEYLKSAEEMGALFPDHPEALATTLEIAEKVEQYSLDHDPLMPVFPLPEGFEIDGEELAKYAAMHPDSTDAERIAREFIYLRHLSYEGARKRYGELTDALRERLEYELGTIGRMGYPGYFLIVWDFIRAAREMGVVVGPGRGSAAGSVVAYALEITNIDPVRYDLLFERFLNPDRISLPDVDIDFDEDGRAAVLEYVTQKYGSKRVAQIVTFGTMAPKLAIRDVARVQGVPLSESDRLAKLVPDRLIGEKGESGFAVAYRESPDLRAARDGGDDRVRDTLKYAEKLEGSVRQTGVHACGVVIAPDDIEKFAPMAITRDRETGRDINVVQYEGKLIESVGLIKMDFLGLKTLSIIKEALDNIEHVRGVRIDIDAVALDDRKTYELYSRGDTTGLFQFESPGMKKHLRNLKPNRFEDLIAMNALYRPGPMEYIPSFIRRKHGDERVEYDAEGMEEYLADTYGITVYQEQVMLLSQKLAGFTGGEADTLRKAMGKKQRAVLDKMKPKFVEGMAANGHDLKVSDKIWSDWEAFAAYAFNKSHSTCYAYVSYQTAWLKAHYPAEFMAALLSRNNSDIKKLSFFMDECRRMGIVVAGPDVNESLARFSADKDGNVRFGLAGIKGVGGAAVEHLLEERKRGGRFTSAYDLVERVNLQIVNKKNLECLAMAGALDSISQWGRGCFFIGDGAGDQPTFLESLMRYGQRVQSERNSSQQSLFGGAATVEVQKPEPPKGDEWTKLELLNKERDVVGLYLSSHPLDDYKLLIDNFCNLPLSALEELARIGKREFVVAGMVTAVQHMFTKSGQPFGKFTLEDYGGSHTFTMFAKDYETFRKYMYPDYYLMVRGKVQPHLYRKDELEAKVTSVMQLHEAQDLLVKDFVLTVPLDEITGEMAAGLSALVRGQEEGRLRLRVRVIDRESGISLPMFSKSLRVNITTELTRWCEQAGVRYTLN